MKRLHGRAPFCELIACLALATVCFFVFLTDHNAIMALRRQIPPLSREKEALQEEIVALEMALEQRRAPALLLEAARRPAMGHLRPCRSADLLSAPEAR